MVKYCAHARSSIDDHQYWVRLLGCHQKERGKRRGMKGDGELTSSERRWEEHDLGW